MAIISPERRAELERLTELLPLAKPGTRRPGDKRLEFYLGDVTVWVDYDDVPHEEADAVYWLLLSARTALPELLAALRESDARNEEAANALEHARGRIAEAERRAAELEAERDIATETNRQWGENLTELGDKLTARNLERDDLRSRLAAFEKKIDEYSVMWREAKTEVEYGQEVVAAHKEATCLRVLLDGCHAAIDAAGLPKAMDAQTAISVLAERLAASESQAAAMREALERIAGPGQHTREEYPDSPALWTDRFDCTRCDGFGADVDHLDGRHKADCPIALARAALSPTPAREYVPRAEAEHHAEALSIEVDAHARTKAELEAAQSDARRFEGYSRDRLQIAIERDARLSPEDRERVREALMECESVLSVLETASLEHLPECAGHRVPTDCDCGTRQIEEQTVAADAAAREALSLLSPAAPTPEREPERLEPPRVCGVRHCWCDATPPPPGPPNPPHTRGVGGRILCWGCVNRSGAAHHCSRSVGRVCQCGECAPNESKERP